jgi:hypothetical protein
MHRGDTVALRMGDATFTGRIRGVGHDVATIEVGDDRVDVAVHDGSPLVLRVVERARAGGTRGDPPSTFRARLLELEATRCDVEVGLASGDVLRGPLVVGADHLIVDAHVIARSAVAWVRRGPGS